MSDSISRQDAVSEIDEWIQMATGNETDMAIKDFLSFLKKRIESLPSAEPKTGKWVKIIDEETPNLTKWHYECDQCGAGRWEEGQRYCQNCGADMRGEQDE